MPVAHISLIDERGAVEEVVRAREAGCRAVYLSPDPAARAGRGLSDPAFDRFWSTVEDLDVPVGVHVIVQDKPAFAPPAIARAEGSALFSFAFLAIDVMAAFTEMLASGVFEKHPRLRCTVLESGATWIAAWLDRMDHKFEVMRTVTPTSMELGEYFFLQCIVSADPDETVLAPIIEAVGSDYFVWVWDYPTSTRASGSSARSGRRSRPSVRQTGPRCSDGTPNGSTASTSLLRSDRGRPAEAVHVVCRPHVRRLTSG